MHMKPKMIWANLGVSDLARTTKFYTELGFKPNGTNGSNELVSFSFGDDGFVINFFSNDLFKANLKIELSDPQRVAEVVFTLSANGREQVGKWASEIEEAGGQLLSRPEAFGEGYYGFLFADPDGHRFNVFYMEGF